MTTTLGTFTSPADAPEYYYRAKIGGVYTPGVIPPKGITGWSLKTDYDVKKGKGADDATMTNTGTDPPKGKIKYQIWRNGTGDSGEDDASVPNDHDDDDNFVTMLLAASAANKALDIVHPIVNQLKVSSVVVTEIGQKTDEGLGLWSREIEFQKWVPEPKAAGGTPAAAQNKDDADPDADKPSADPIAGPDGPNKQLYKEFSDKKDEAQNGGDDE